MNKLFRMKVYGSTEQQIDEFLARVYQVVEELHDSEAGKSVGLLIHEVVPMPDETSASAGGGRDA